MQIAIFGAGYTGGEADRLRRDMAAWRKSGSLEKHHERLLVGFRERGIPEAFGEQLYKQIQGFGEYGFPESHAASFALLVYASAWLKVHYPAEFAAALVNSQPMGFYSPSTLLQDAQRHGVILVSLDVGVSDWDCVCVRPHREGQTSLRLGLRLVNGFGRDSALRLMNARAIQPFESLEDLRARANLGKKELVALAESGALDALCGGRREALWNVVSKRATGLFEGIASDEARPSLAKMSRAEQLVLDYERTGVSVNCHPMKLLRSRLPTKVRSSGELLSIPSKTRVCVAGMVICRQRPGTASGVVFVTMEDEFGFVNLVLWSRVFEAYRSVVTTSTLLMVHGRIERSDDPRKSDSVSLAPSGPATKTAQDGHPAQSVVYVVADHLETLDPRLPTMGSMSRDFH